MECMPFFAASPEGEYVAADVLKPGERLCALDGGRLVEAPTWVVDGSAETAQAVQGHDDSAGPDWFDRVFGVGELGCLLRPLSCVDTCDVESRMIASELPLRAPSDDCLDSGHVLVDADLCQRGLKALLSREARQLKGELSGGENSTDAAETAQLMTSGTEVMQQIEQELSWLRACKLEGQMIPSTSDADENACELPQFLQTRTFTNEEVMAEWDENWERATQAELTSLLETKKALIRVDDDTIAAWVASGAEVTQVPSKTVFTRKAVSGRYKCRIVVCGNALPNVGESSLERRMATYAGGVDVSLLRVLLAEAVFHKHDIATWDVSTAFLNAPARPRDLRAAARGKTQIVIAVPPRSLVRKGLVPAREKWKVELAVYGLDTSPRDWSLHRNDTLRVMVVLVEAGALRFKACVSDSSVWLIFLVDSAEDAVEAGVLVGWLAVYVDDFLAATRKSYLKAIYGCIKQTWDCGAVEFVGRIGESEPLRFDGLELHWDEKGEELCVHQTSYVRGMLDRHSDVVPQQVPLARHLPQEGEVEPDSDALKECQQLVGELLWIAVRTRPDVAYSCSRIASVMSRRPREACKAALGVLGYLATTSSLGLRFSMTLPEKRAEIQKALQDGGLLEVHTDAGFAPEGSRSQECVIIYWRGCCVSWVSSRQPFIAQSTCEAELISTIQGHNMGDAVACLLDEIYPAGSYRKVLLNDNSAAIGVLAADTNSWRTRHLKIRAGALREKVALFQWEVMHLEGASNTADIGTKPLQAPRLDLLRGLLGMGSAKGSVLPSKVQRLAKILGSMVISLCVNPSEGSREVVEVTEPNDSDNWTLYLLLILWTISVIAVWEVVRRVADHAWVYFTARPAREPESDPESEPPEFEPLEEDNLPFEAHRRPEMTRVDADDEQLLPPPMPPHRPPMPVRFPEPEPEHDAYAAARDREWAMLLDAQAAQLNAHDAAVPQGEPLEFRYVDDVAYLDPVVLYFRILHSAFATVGRCLYRCPWSRSRG